MSERDHLLKVLQRAVSIGASDVHLHSGAPVAFRINGNLTVRGSAELPVEVATNMAMGLLREDQRQEFEENGQIEIVVNADGITITPGPGSCTGPRSWVRGELSEHSPGRPSRRLSR